MVDRVVLRAAAGAELERRAPEADRRDLGDIALAFGGDVPNDWCARKRVE